jgi:hypothetical protein
MSLSSGSLGRQAVSAACAVIMLAASPRPLLAQPSGGPYGPLPQTYAIPEAAHVYYVAPNGKADSPGRRWPSRPRSRRRSRAW